MLKKSSQKKSKNPSFFLAISEVTMNLARPVSAKWWGEVGYSAMKSIREVRSKGSE